MRTRPGCHRRRCLPCLTPVTRVSVEAGAASPSPSSESDSDSDSSSSDSSSSDSDSDSDFDSEDSSSSSSLSSDEESEREEAAEEEADEARASVRLRDINEYLRRIEQRTRRRRRWDARWLRGNIDDRFANTKPSTKLLQEVLLRQTYRRSFRY